MPDDKVAAGRLHSFQSLGAVDGPGLRCVVFLQGCPLRCAYCHNPDTWDFSGGTASTAEEVCRRVLRYKPYFGAEGGATLSGGEALSQPGFAAALLRLLQKEGIHTALDTSGVGDLAAAREILRYTDLILCDIKFSSETDYRRYCGGSLRAVEDFLRLSEEMEVPLWVRHVVVPGLTDREEEVSKVLAIAQKYKNLQRIELLPFRKLCQSKYDAMGIPFPLERTPSCGKEALARLTALIPPALR